MLCMSVQDVVSLSLTELSDVILPLIYPPFIITLIILVHGCFLLFPTVRVFQPPTIPNNQSRNIILLMHLN